ncbi:MAG: tRNA epoxyqueuosine(34) reductase QueG [Acidobacteria bacterium]|nr:tRNA epoxyqueuosine(34) reductase QueG [Acidobacteriota bacterium]
MPLTASQVKGLASKCGFELAGVSTASPAADYDAFAGWVHRGLAGKMGYLTDHRKDIRQDPHRLLPSARSILCVGKVYKIRGEAERSPIPAPLLGWISRYAWGHDYHRILRRGLERLAAEMLRLAPFDYRISVDTAPLLERSYARLAGLGWIGKNTCLINQQLGSWIFLGEMLTSLDLAPDSPPPDRCGTCRRCIDACPTQAIVPGLPGGWELDARLCISYLTIELRGPIPEEHRPAIGRHVFGCDICQDACPWNGRAAVTRDPVFRPVVEEPPLEKLAALSEHEFKEIFGPTPVARTRYRGFLRNVAVAMGNSGSPKFRAPLERLAASPDPVIAGHARWALAQLQSE